MFSETIPTEVLYFVLPHGFRNLNDSWFFKSYFSADSVSRCPLFTDFPKY